MKLTLQYHNVRSTGGFEAWWKLSSSPCSPP